MPAGLIGEPVGKFVARQTILELLVERNQLNGIEGELVERVGRQVRVDLPLVGLKAVQRPRACKGTRAAYPPVIGGVTPDEVIGIGSTHSTARVAGFVLDLTASAALWTVFAAV